jgi:hypothetical protein
MPAEGKNEYMKKYRLANIEKIRERKKKYNLTHENELREKRRADRKANPEKYREMDKEQKRKIKMKVLQHYGIVCSCPGCGESNIEFLAIDHIEGGGRQHRKEVGNTIYNWLIKNNFPEGFRTLCHNCNHSLGSYGYCPHQNESQIQKDESGK